jgi:ribosomal protein S18 acetylase RimI-like enzyme
LTLVEADIAIEPIPAGFERWEALLALIRRAFAPMDGVIDPPSSVHRLTTETLRAKAQSEIGFLAWAGATIVGCAFIAEQADHFYLGKLAVLPVCQGRGIGRCLLEAAERHAVRAGKPLIELQTRVELTANQQAFRSLGFVETGRTAHPGFDRPTSVTMQKRLV